MRIVQILITSLFGVFDHVIPSNLADRITVIHAPNGYGKTIVLKILESFHVQSVPKRTLKLFTARNFAKSG